MAAAPDPRFCPDCGDLIHFTFSETSGLDAWKRGEGYNMTPDTQHYVCFSCGKAWKQRLNGPLTPDVVGDIAFFSCRRDDCGLPLAVSRESAAPIDIELRCAHGHRFAVRGTDEGGLTIEAIDGL
jgi:hypothetical protein